MQNNIKKIVIAILFLLILALLAYFSFFKKTTKPVDTTGMQKESTGSTNDSTMNGSMMDLWKAGKTVSCTYTSANADYSMKGTTYVAGKKMRTDSVITTKGTTSETHMISDGEWIYNWTSASQQGVKMKLAEMEKKIDEYASGATDSTNSTTSEAMKDFQQDYDFSCKPWKEDASQFVSPTNIQFMDLTQLMTPPSTGTTPGSTDNKAAMCGACNYAQSEADKVKCRQQLGC